MRKIENNIPSTRYAPAERASIEIVKKQVELFEKNDILTRFLSKVPSVFIILNKYRQVVYMNDGALEFSGLEELTSIIGKRPGEIFGCIHHAAEEGGCGTAEACTYCGAINTVLSSQKGKSSVQDCRLTCAPNEVAFDLRVWASPLEFEGEKFTAVTIQDISNEKRHEVIERIFFHDILNTISGISSAVQLLLEYGEETDKPKYLQMINRLTNGLTDEVQFHRMLMSAESNDLKLSLTKFNSIDFLKDLRNDNKSRAIAKEKKIHTDSNSDNVEITTDRTILRRIVSNMIINALEATPIGGEVKVGCRVINSNIEIWVHNQGTLSREVQMQVFQRSFSTKAENRGLGTYSMRLLSSFLKGKVNFLTSKDTGTIFIVDIPLNGNN